MAYNEKLADRIRAVLMKEADLSERKMFGGLCFMLGGNMCCGVLGDDLMLRMAPETQVKVVGKPHARAMDFTGRPMKGMLYVGAEGIKRASQLQSWLQLSVDFASALPAKAPKAVIGKSKDAKAKRATKAKVAASPKAAKAKVATKTAGPAPFVGFSAKTFRFLKALSDNNDKAWFTDHRDDYEAAYLHPALSFVQDMGPQLQKLSKTVSFEPRINGSLFRIHRDVRFSKDKTPFKDHIDLWFWEGPDKGWSTPGFFLRLSAKSLILGCGMHRFDKAQLERYRAAVADPKTGAALQRALATATAKGPYALPEPTRKRVPKGYDAEHARADLLRQDGLHLTWTGKPPKEAKSEAFVPWCHAHYKALMPLHRWLLKHVVSA